MKLLGVLALFLAAPVMAQPLELEQGDRILVVGNTFAERMAESGYLHALVQARHPELELWMRSAAWSADEAGLKPREMNVPTTQDWIATYEPDVVFMFYGMAESFGGVDGLEPFAADLRAMIDEVRGEAGRRVVLFSPIAHEDLGAPWPETGQIDAHNTILGVYVQTMRTVADEAGVMFVDLFDATLDFDGELTSNGIHPTESGCGEIARLIDAGLGWEGREDKADDAAGAARMRELACDLHYLMKLRYHPTNTEYVWGRRAEPFGVVNFPPEMEQLERMIEARQRAMWALGDVGVEAVLATQGDEPIWASLPSVTLPEDAWTPEPVEAKGTETSLGSTDIKSPDDFLASFTLPDGYVIECFASEEDFEELASPVALTFDARGRLWVMCIPTYPHLLPGDEPRCKLLILEDTDGDGRADTRTVFADRLYIPTGFAVDVDAVYVGQAPDLLRLRDLDGDDRADTREVVLSGFAMPDSHHQISAFEWMPGGGFIMNEGVFSITGIETPYGVRRTRDAAVWKFDPRTERLETLSHCGFANPWGHAYDDYGSSVLADASGGSNYAFSHVIHAFEYPRKPDRPGHILNRGRPTAGCELISSRHFPEDVQDTFLVNQSIGFHGTRWDRLVPDGSSWRSERLPQDMIECSDVNFRPVAMEIGPDGALYIVDWCNPIIGHMQYSVRDPRRDSSHGRIWRVRHADRPLVTAPDVAGASIPDLLELLRLPERNTRQLARRRLQTANTDELFPLLARWIQDIDPNDPLRDRMHLEALWILQGQGVVDVELAGHVLGLYEPRARAGAVRVLRHWLQAGDVSTGEVSELVLKAASDPDMRVRLEAAIAAGFMSPATGGEVVTRTLGHEMDGAMAVVVRETIKHLGPDAGSSTLVRRVQLEAMTPEQLGEQEMDEVVAGVMLSRADVPREARLAALASSAGDDPAEQAQLLTTLIETAPTMRHADAVATLMFESPPEAVAPAAGRLAALSHDHVRGKAATAVLLSSGDPVSDVDASVLIGAMALLPEGTAPPSVAAHVRGAVEGGVVDPSGAIEQLVRHDEDEAGLFRWLIGLIDEVEGVSFGEWTSSHERAMAAWRGVNSLSSWPDDHEMYRVAAARESYLRGEAIYHDEGIGCVRCHADDGSGLEGFPPINRSPWIVGDPVRAATIVIHGLQGPISVAGADYNSAMAPLGGLLDDQQVADVLTFARQSWGNFAPAVTVEDAATARANGPRMGIWSVDELAAAHPLERDGFVTVPVSEAQAVTASATRPSLGLIIGAFAAAVGVTVVLAIALAKLAKATA